MKTTEIRPHTTYIGPDGLLRKVKTVTMTITGDLNVEWKAVKLPRKSNLPTWGIERIAYFADWATGVHETLSEDLEAYLALTSRSR